MNTKTVVLTLILILCPNFVLSKQIPVTANTIRKYADIVVIGSVSSDTIENGRRKFRVSVNDTIFERSKIPKQILIFDTNESKKFNKIILGKTYLFVAGRCEDGSYVLLGNQFVAEKINDNINTRNWIGFSTLTNSNEMKSKIGHPLKRDSFLTNLLCAPCEKLADKEGT